MIRVEETERDDVNRFCSDKGNSSQPYSHDTFIHMHLLTVDKYHIAISPTDITSLYEQDLSILYHKAKVRLKFITFAGVGLDGC